MDEVLAEVLQAVDVLVAKLPAPLVRIFIATALRCQADQGWADVEDDDALRAKAEQLIKDEANRLAE